MEDRIKQDFDNILEELEKTLKEFSDIQKIVEAQKNGKVKLSASKLKKLEAECELLKIKIEQLNQRAKILKNI